MHLNALSTAMFRNGKYLLRKCKSNAYQPLSFEIQLESWQKRSKLQIYINIRNNSNKMHQNANSFYEK